MVEKLFYILFVFLLSSCNTLRFMVQNPEYTVRSDIAKVNINHQKENAIYITNKCSLNICKLIFDNVIKDIKSNPSFKLVSSPKNANYVLSLDNKLFTRISDDQINVIKSYITYASLSNQFMFDSNNNPHILENKSLISMIGDTKTIFQGNPFYNSKILASLGIGGMGAFSAFLIPGVASIPIAGVISIGLGGLTYIIMNEIQDVGIIGSFSIDLDVKNEDLINTSAVKNEITRKSVNKIGNNIIEESFAKYSSDYTTFNSNVYILATGSKIISSDMDNDIIEFLSASILQILYN